MPKTLTIGLLALLLFGFCGKGQKETGGDAQPTRETIQKPQAASPGQTTLATPFQIKELIFSPTAPTSADSLEVKPVVADTPNNDLTFVCRWTANNQEIEAVKGLKLDKSYFKKGAWVSCQVKAVRAGQESAWKKSNLIQIANSLPSIEFDPVQAFQAPGRFSYQIRAIDPDDDELTYSLLSPQDMGIKLDETSGKLEWDITADAIAKLGTSFEITYTVNDSSGGQTEGYISLALTKKE